MPDLNELLRWSIQNSTLPSDDSAQPSGELSLSFRPTQTPGAANSALHPSDPQYNVSSLPIDHGSTPATTAPSSRQQQPLPTDIIDLILGKEDSVVMKEKMAIAIDKTQSTEDRVSALDDFEMLIESIDNANNMAVLKLWEPLMGLLQPEEESDVISHAAWIVGTAVQNNLKAQAALYLNNALPLLLSLIYPPTPSSTPQPTSVRSKATYALSSALKHWPQASTALSSDSSRGYKTLSRGVSDPTPVIRRKMSFLIGTLVMQSGETYTGEIPPEVQALLDQETGSTGTRVTLLEGLEKEGVFTALLKTLEKDQDEVDVEFEENAMRALSQAVEKGAVNGDEKVRLSSIWKKWGSEGQKERGFEGDDQMEIDRILA